MLTAFLLALSTDLTQATQVEQELYEADTGVSLFHEILMHNLCSISFLGRKNFKNYFEGSISTIYDYL